MTAYLKRLAEEITQAGKAYGDREISSIFFGGGTPSSLPEGEIGALTDAVRSAFFVHKDAEITIECNPGTLNRGKLNEYRAAGINRLSFGLQSVHDDELKLLGRIHSYADFAENYRAAREAGFRNINVDLMSGLPGQSVPAWEETLRSVAELVPEHLSAYSLIIEEGTPFYEKYRNGGPECAAELPLPDEDTERRMVHATGRILSEYGYRQYEISNYAKPGWECRHNLVYWRRGDYLGLGLGAAGCVDELRWKNTSDLTEYLDGESGTPGALRGSFPIPREEEEKLSREDCRFEAVMLGLRLNEGILLDGYRERYGEDLSAARADWIGKMTKEGLLETADGRLHLTERGRDLMDYVVREY